MVFLCVFCLDEAYAILSPSQPLLLYPVFSLPWVRDAPSQLCRVSGVLHLFCHRARLLREAGNGSLTVLTPHCCWVGVGLHSWAWGMQSEAQDSQSLQVGPRPSGSQALRHPDTSGSLGRAEKRMVTRRQNLAWGRAWAWLGCGHAWECRVTSSGD